MSGTLAAGIQSFIGSVAAGGLFATAQGIAMGAGIPVLAQVVGGAIAGVVGLVVAAAARPLSRLASWLFLRLKIVLHAGLA